MYLNEDTMERNDGDGSMLFPSTDLIGEGVVVDIGELHTFPNHPFKVVHDEAMDVLIESIRLNGVLNRIIIRPREAGGFEIVAGHRRVEACKSLGLTVIPADLRPDMDDDSAVLAMLETNLKQRTKLLPSERAAAYRMMRDTLAHRGVCTDENEPGRRTNARISECYGESARQVARYIRLTELAQALQEQVDAGKLKVGAAVEISYLPDDVQMWIAEHYAQLGAFPTPAQARQLRKLDADAELDRAMFDAVMASEREKKDANADVDFLDELRSEHFPDLTRDDVRQKIMELVEGYLHRRRIDM